MTTPQPRRRVPEWAARTWRVAAAAGRPWAVWLAVLGAAAMAAPLQSWTANRLTDRFPAGPVVTVSGGSTFFPRSLILGWAGRGNPRAEVLWADLDPLGPGLRRVEVGFAPSAVRSADGGPPAGPRPPGAAPDLTMLWVSVWWLLGPPAAWSVFAVRRAPRAPAAGPPRGWRFARPWAAVWAVLGVGALADGETVPPIGPGVLWVVCEPARGSKSGWHPRSVRAGWCWTEGAVGSAPPCVDVGLWWLVLVPAAANAGRAVAGRRAVRRTGRSGAPDS